MVESTLLIPRKSIISFKGKDFQTYEDIIVVGSVEGLKVKKTFYYHEVVDD